MMKLLIAGLFAVAATNVFPAMLYTNEVNGVKWVYSVSDGKATLGGGNSSQRAIVGAVPENVVVPSTFGDIQVSSIASYAFSGFSGITNLVVPTSVQNIGYGAFGGCTSLKLLTIPFVGNRRGDISGTGALFGSMFGNYSSASSRETRQSYYSNGTRIQTSYIPTNLTSVVVTDETKIGDYAFQNCTMLTNIVVNDTVSNIGSYAFQNCSGLKIHPIPSSVATIGSYAFQNCTALTEINLPNTVRKLNDYAFDNCWRVAALTIQNSVTNIGQYAFQKCSGLTTLSVPNSVEYIGYNAFGGCYRLSAMTLPFIGSRRGNANGYGDNFGYVFGSSSSGDSASVRQYYYYNNGNSSSYNTYYIPTNLTSVIITDESVVRPYAFQNCTMLTNIVVNDTVSTIGNYAFSGCTAMPCFNIPASAISIGSYAFSGCASLSDVQISSSVKWIGSYAFQNCSRLFEVDLPEGVCRIYDYAFSGCSHASSLTIPNTVTNIGQYAFQNCSSLISVEVPKSVMYIGYNAFGGCHNLSSLQLPFVGSQRGNANGYGDNFGYIFGSSSGSTGCSSVRQNYYYNNGNNSSSYTYYIPTGLTSVTITDETLLRPYAFQNCTMLTNIVMNSGVTGVGSYAFSGCTGLRSFSVPDSATSIGSYAFYGCSAISELTVPANVRSIGSYAFQNCSNLTSLRILSDYVAIDQYAFSGCPASMFDTTSVAGLKLLDGYVVGAESTLSGVVDLSKTRGVIANAFYCNTKITKVVLPDGMTLIPAYAFYGCSSLASITIPDTVQSINSSAFGGCTSLTTVTIPDATTSIGDNAFSGCRNISTVKMPKNLKTIGSYTFQNCTSLLALNLPDGLQSIGYYAFAYCSSLRSMTIPATLKTIGSGAFYGDTKLATVNISDLSAWCKISFGDASSNPTYYSHSLTLNGEVIHDLIVPDDIGGLLDYAFCDNYALTSVAVPDGVTAIPRSAFSRCGGITNAVLPESVADIKMYAFQGCTNIAEFAFPPSVTNIDAYAFAECNGLASLNLPPSLQTIRDYSFYKCHGISSVEIPSNVVSIGQYAFNTCTNLSSVTVHSGLTSIGNSAFYGCSRLTVTLADDVGTVPSSLFRYCGGIYDVVFAESVTNIASSAFYGCSYITNLQLPTHLNRIGDYAFYGCTSLSDVVIPEGVNSIGQYAFSGCTKLTHAVLPSTAKNIGQYAFSGCTKLSSVDLTEGTTSIGGYAFRNCTGLKSVVLPATVKTVGDYAFEGCAGLGAVSFPDGLTTIGNYSFRNCRSLSSLEIPSSVSKVGDYAFEGCNGLTNLAIPQGVATIGSYAFRACTNLVSLSVPASATNIGWYAFAACSNLTQVTLLTTPSQVIPTADIELKQSDWSVVDGDTIVTDSPKMTSMMKDEMTGVGVLSFEWKVPGYWYHSSYYNTDYFEPTGYLSVTFDDYWYEYSWYGESCGSEDWQSVTTSLGGRSWHTLDWWYDRYYSYYYGNEVNIDQNTNHGRIRSLSFIQGRSGGAGVNGTVIGASAFEGCVKLARVDIEDVGAWCGTIFENAWANPLRYARRLHVNGEELRNLVIPDTANAVAGWAFADCGTITNVVIPQGVAYIGSHAFQGLNIGEIVLPSSVTNVGSFAFAGCDGVKTLSLTSGLKKINDFAFSGQSRILSATLPSTTVLSKYVPDSLGSIRAITIAEGETEIIDNAFAGCAALESIAIPDSIARIGQYAFKGCSRLTEINIPASANVVSYNVFDDCARLREIVVDGGNASYSSRDGIFFDERGNGETLARCPQAIETKNYAVPESVARISNYAFAGCVGIEKVTVPASVADIGTRAFKDCGSLAGIDVADDNLAYKSIEGVLFTKDGSTLLRFPPAKAGHYDIPEGVTTIAPYAFEGCVKLTTISFGTDVNAVEAHAFDGCVLLSQAVLNAGLTRIGDYVFANCASLAAMTLPEAVTSLGEGAFDGCDQLVSLYIPENITIKPMKIGGLIRGTKSLYRGCVYNVTNDLIIAGGAQLTIPAGVTLKLTQWRSVIVRNNGRLVASGTRAAPVVFTALADDDFGGDTNGDGSSSRPQAGAWSGLNVFGEADLSYTRIRYGSTLLNVENAPSWEWYGGSSDDYWMDYEYDYNDGKSGIVNLDGCVLEHSDSNGIVNYGGKVFAHNSMFTDLDTAIMGYAWGYYGDGATGTNLFVNCVVEGCDYATYSYTWYDSGYYYSDGAAAFENCILANIQGWVDDGNGVPNERIPEGIIFRNCCFWNPVDEFYPIQTNSLVGVDGNIWDNPQFENVEGGDYRIKAASPCVDAGCDGSNVPVRDYFGQPRNGTPDIGIHEVQVRPVDDADLAALSVSGDAMAEIGGTITVAWTVGNVGTVDIANEWRDVLELVDANGRAVELGRHTVINGLVSGGNLTFTASYPVPSMSPGTARLRLKVNPFRDIYEGSLTANNIYLSEATIDIVLPAYNPAVNSNFDLRAGGSVALRVPAGSGTTAFRITPSATSGSGVVAISAYALAGGVPAGLRYDVMAQPLTNGVYLLVLPKDADDTDYNIAVFNDGTTAATVKLESVSDALSVLEVAPSRLANTGEGHIAMLGVGMDRVSNVRLEGSQTISASKFRTDSSANLSATFDMSGATVGNYAVVLVDEDGATYHTSQTVEVYNPKIGPKLEAWLELPSSTRQGRVYTGRICYRNSGDEDMLAPCFSLSVENALIGLNMNEVLYEKLDVLAIGASLPYGILKAQEMAEIGFVFKSGARPQFNLTHLDGTSETWRLSEAAMADAATILNSRGRLAVSLESLQPYMESVADEDVNLAAICGHVIVSDDVASEISVVAETEEGQFVAADVVDENGVFVLDGLANATNYIVKVSGGAVAEAVLVEMPSSGDRVGLTINATTIRTLVVSVEGVPEGESSIGYLVIYDGNANEMVRCGIEEKTTVEYASTNVYDILYFECILESGRRVFQCGIISPYDSEYGMSTAVDFSESTLLCGSVETVGGVAVPGAVVRVRSIDCYTEREVSVSDDGTYSIGALEEGIYIIDAMYDGCVSHSCEVQVQKGDKVEINLVLPIVPTTSVSVYTSANENDFLQLMIIGADEKVQRTYFITNNVCTITDLPQGQYDFFLLNESGKSVASPITQELVGDSENQVVFHNSRSVTVSGVLINNDGNGVSGVVCFYPDKGLCFTVETDEAGCFSIAMPSGYYWMACNASGYEPKSCYTDLQQNSSVEIMLKTDSDYDNEENSNSSVDTVGDYIGQVITGGLKATTSTRLEFISDHSVIAYTELMPPNGRYAITNAPVEYSHLWMTDVFGSGRLVTKESFLQNGCTIDMEDNTMLPVVIQVFADNAKTIPMANVELVVMGAQSNIITRTTDFQGVASLRLSQGTYQVYGFRLFAAEGDVMEFEVRGTDRQQINYAFASGYETAMASWYVRTPIIRNTGLRSARQSEVFGANVVSLMLDELADSSIPLPVRGELRALEASINFYSSSASQYYVGISEPVYKCPYNLKMWEKYKKEYKVARMKFDAAQTSALYDLQLLRNAYQRFFWMVIYKAPGYIPGVGWAFALPTTIGDMARDIIDEDKNKAAVDETMLGMNIYEGGELFMMDRPELVQSILDNEEKIAMNERRIKELDKIKSSTTSKINNQIISGKSSSTPTWQLQRQQAAIDAEIRSLGDENKALKSANKALESEINDAVKWIQKKAPVTKSANAAKVGKAGKAAKALKVSPLSVATTGVSLVADWHYDLKQHAEDIVRFHDCLMDDLKKMDNAIGRLEAINWHSLNNDPCLTGYGLMPDSTNVVDLVSLNTPISVDPNEMSGPMGVGDSETERFLKPGEEATYTIYFENKSDAETAAQEIRVTETLDPALDWSTFRLGEVAFNNQIDNNLSGCSSGMSEVKMNGTNYYVRTEVSFDATTGKVTWYLRIVDKTTPDEWPTDLHAGILPPNDSTFRGEGHLTYRVNVRKDAAPGTRINASASIVFDYNAAIVTDPAWWNTVAQVAGVTVYDEVEDGKTDLDLIVGQPYGELPIPKPREGYTFVGWWTALGGPNGTGRQVTPESLVEADDTALYSYWTKDTPVVSTYTVIFDANGGEGTMAAQIFTNDVAQALTSNAFTRTSYRFLGWATNETGEVVYEDGAAVSNLTTVAGGVVDFYAAWDLITMEVAFDLNHVDAQESVSPVVVTNGVAYGALPDATRTGYTFIGWTNGQDAHSPSVMAETIVTNETDHTLYAQWTVNAYTVTFDANGGDGGKTVTQNYGTMITAPTVTRTGYAFVGWSPEISATVPASNVTFTAQYATIPYAITYTGLKDATNPNPATYTVEDAITFAAPGEVYGWVFNGWTPASIALGSIGDVEASANWERQKFDVTVNGETHQYSYEDIVTLVTNDFINIGATQYVCKGWTATNANPSSGEGARAEFRVLGDVVLNWLWKTNVVTLAQAVNAEDLDWSTGGAAEWQPEWSDAANDGLHNARSGTIGNNANTWIETTIEGAGTLSFVWKSSTEARYDMFQLIVDGEVKGTISGETPWTTNNIVLAGGTHTIRWNYRKSRSGTAGADMVWLDSVTWTADVPPTLAEALNPDLFWTTVGDVEWTAVRKDTILDPHDDWATVGGLVDYESSLVRTEVYGAGVLTFDWAVSCEDGYDWFDFIADGEIRESITGATGWKTVTIEFKTGGKHILQWEYWKDDMDEAELVGDNCARLDNVRWTLVSAESQYTTTTPHPIPFADIRASYSNYWVAAEGDYEAAAKMTGRNGYAIWESYVAGLEPDDESSKFEAKIEIVDGKPVVTWEPDSETLRATRTYTTYGKKTLLDRDWTPVTDANKDEYNFFKVDVKMK